MWGSSVRASPQVCGWLPSQNTERVELQDAVIPGLKHELQDEDVMQITKLTAASSSAQLSAAQRSSAATVSSGAPAVLDRLKG